VQALLHSFSTSALDVSGQLRTAVVLPPGKHPPVPTGKEVEGVDGIDSPGVLRTKEIGITKVKAY